MTLTPLAARTAVMLQSVLVCNVNPAQMSVQISSHVYQHVVVSHQAPADRLVLHLPVEENRPGLSIERGTSSHVYLGWLQDL